MLEIVGHEGDMRRLGDARFGEAGALVALRRGMVELDHAKPVARLEPIGEGVEPRAEHKNLANAGADGGPSGILRKAAAHRD
ncbi:MAG TPA: hypothetical protein VEH77_12885 [Roseiarcus sp.]|nr:hypothetical protein [Roseiarcus sp.]